MLFRSLQLSTFFFHRLHYLLKFKFQNGELSNRDQNKNAGSQENPAQSTSLSLSWKHGWGLARIFVLACYILLAFSGNPLLPSMDRAPHAPQWHLPGPLLWRKQSICRLGANLIFRSVTFQTFYSALNAEVFLNVRT